MIITAGRGCGIKISTIFVAAAEEDNETPTTSSPMAADVNATVREWDTVKISKYSS